MWVACLKGLAHVALLCAYNPALRGGHAFRGAQQRSSVPARGEPAGLPLMLQEWREYILGSLVIGVGKIVEGMVGLLYQEGKDPVSETKVLFYKYGLKPTSNHAEELKHFSWM